MVEGARLESEYTSKAYRGFESHPLRHIPLILLDIYLQENRCPLSRPLIIMAKLPLLLPSSSKVAPNVTLRRLPEGLSSGALGLRAGVREAIWEFGYHKVGSDRYSE